MHENTPEAFRSPRLGLGLMDGPSAYDASYPGSRLTSLYFVGITPDDAFLTIYTHNATIDDLQ